MSEHTDPADPHAAHGDDHHGSNVGKFIMVFIALCILTAASFTVGSMEGLMQDAPQIGWTIMMAISCAKALLVMLFFMHLLWEANWKYVLTIPASIMSLFLLLMLFPDVKGRTEKYSAERWLHAAVPQQPADDAHSDDAHAEDGEHQSGSH